MLTHEQRMQLLDAADELRFLGGRLQDRMRTEQARLKAVDRQLEASLKQCDRIQATCEDTIRICDEYLDSIKEK